MNTATRWSSLSRSAARSTNPFAALGMVTVSKPAMLALAGLVPCALSGVSTTERVSPSSRKWAAATISAVSSPCAPAAGCSETPGKPLISARYCCSSNSICRIALQRRLRLVRMHVQPTRQRRESFVALRIVLHRARSERIEMRVDRHVHGRQVGEVANDVGFGQFRQWRRRTRPGPRAATARRFPAHPHRRPAAANCVGRAGRVRTSVEWLGCYAWIVVDVLGSAGQAIGQQLDFLSSSLLGDRHQEAIGQFRVPSSQGDAGQDARLLALRPAVPALGRGYRE